MTNMVRQTQKKAGGAVGIAPLLQPVHCQPELIGVYACGVYSANLRALLGCRRPGCLAEPGPRLSKISRVYVAWASGLFGLLCCQAYASHTTLVAVPGMMPFVGPTGYVYPFSQIAETVRDAGVERTYEKFHAKVMGCDSATLKNAIVVCGG